MSNSLYGTAAFDGASGTGTLFSISLAPQVTIIPSGGKLNVAWPTNYAGFDYSGFSLESTTDLGSPAWTNNPASPVNVNGQNRVAIPVTGTQQFFRLMQ